MDQKTLDPKGLIFESYRIEGITGPECRSIFLDWALGVPIGEDMSVRIKLLLEEYASAAPDHPMTAVLREGLSDKPTSKRRGGRKARVAE